MDDWEEAFLSLDKAIEEAEWYETMDSVTRGPVEGDDCD